MDNFNVARTCGKCALWSPNGIHPRSEEYPGPICLERVDEEGITYRTDSKLSCHHFREIKIEPLVKPSAAGLVSDDL